MPERPLMTVSGIRGIYGETLSDEFVSRIAYAQARTTGAQRVVIGRDTRPSGKALAQAVTRGVRAAGAHAIDIGIAPTPTTCLATAELKADAGVIITASHNPNPYNGYKMVHRSGRLCNDTECTAVYRAFDAFEQSGNTAPIPECEPAQTADTVETHLDRICAVVDVSLIRGAAISVAIDSTNGAAGVIFPRLLERLGVTWVGVHNKLDGDFVHNPEPRPEHLTDLAALLKKTGTLWAGFAFDPDADRLAPMGEHGEAISEEMTLALAMDAILSLNKTDFATNLSTSMVMDDVARKHGVAVHRTKIGEANVVEGMLAHGCNAGGEGNGGVIYPRISTVRDGLAALALIIEQMARTGTKITGLVSQWPTYVVVKEKIVVDNGAAGAIMASLPAVFINEHTDTTDGLKIIRPDGWVHIRPSNTEPILRCIAEARSDADARNLINLVMSHVPARGNA